MEVFRVREFYEFDEERYQKKGNVWMFIAIALVFTLLGGILMYAVFPYLTNPDDKLADNTGSIRAESDETTNSDASPLPVVGYQGDLFIEGENPVVQIAEKVGPAVVGITTTVEVLVPDFFFNQRTQEYEGTGSGIVISDKGHIVTNYHVVEGAKKLFVILQGGEKIEAELIGADPQSDVAVIKVDRTDLTVAKLGNSDEVRQGEFAVAIGNPLGHELAGTVNFGVISAVDRTLQLDGKTLKLLQTDAAINEGNSGGALVNMKGEVIGMNTIKLVGSRVEGLGFAIPSNVFIPIAQELIKKGKVEVPEQPWIGVVNPLEITEEISKEYNYPVGILVREVYPESPADISGILPGDVITAFEGVETPTMAILKENIGKHKVGDIVEVTIYRASNKKEFTLKLKLADMSKIDIQR